MVNLKNMRNKGPCHTIRYHIIPIISYHTIPYHTYHTIPHHTTQYHSTNLTIPYYNFRLREMERKTRDLTDEVRSLKSVNDELNRKQRDLMSENDNLNRTCQDLERNNRKLQMEIDHLNMLLKVSFGELL